MGLRRLSSAAALALVVAPAWVRGESRFFRVFSEAHGLRAPAVGALAEDDAGFVWLVSAGGLYRFDGVEMRRILGYTPTLIFQLAPLEDGVAARFEDGSVERVTADGALPLTGPDRTPLHAVDAICRGADGALWVAAQGRIWRLATGRWREVQVAWRDGEFPQHLQAAAGGVVALTAAGAWRLHPDGASHLVDFPRPLAAVEKPAGGWWLLSNHGQVWEWRVGAPVLRHHVPSRAIALLRRGEWTWVALDRAVLALDRDGAVVGDLVTPEMGGGGQLLLDHEGSLWVGTLVGAVQFPAPETTVLSEWRSARFLERDGDTIWVNTWYGAGSIQRQESGWRSVVEPRVRGRFCRDSQGRVWSSIPDEGLVLRQPDGSWRPVAESGSIAGCAEDAAGGLWLASAGPRSGLWRVDPRGVAPRRVPAQPVAAEDLALMLVDSRDRVWVRSGERLCRAGASALATARGPVEWSCDALPGAVTITDLAELPSGAIWASSNRIGVWQIEPGGPRSLRGNAGLASRQILGLVPAADGSLWILGHGTLLRVREDGAAAAEWRVEESVTAWQGALASGGQGLVESPDGALWIATSRGILRVPRSARGAPSAPPRVALVEVRGAAGPLPLAGGVPLPFGDPSLSLRFAALSYRDPALLRYQVRLANRPWPEPSASARLEFPRLDSGEYRVEARASLDGRHWSETASYAFRVAPPWYRTPAALALWLALGFAVLWLAHRARVRVLLALERQRTLVAMDLHDEMGSGLGAIGILSGLMARDGLQGEERRQLAREIAATSQELGGALSEIVWALRSEGATLESLAARLSESGGRLFAGGTTRFDCRFPDIWPPAPLPLGLRRNVLLAGLEALHNAARHAGASRVELALRPLGQGWAMVVEDDGRGLPAGAPEAGNGVGLRSMRRRAREIGGAIRWEAVEPHGTRVVLEFALLAGGVLP